MVKRLLFVSALALCACGSSESATGEPGEAQPDVQVGASRDGPGPSPARDAAAGEGDDGAPEVTDAAADAKVDASVDARADVADGRADTAADSASSRPDSGAHDGAVDVRVDAADAGRESGADANAATDSGPRDAAVDAADASGPLVVGCGPGEKYTIVDTNYVRDNATGVLWSRVHSMGTWAEADGRCPSLPRKDQSLSIIGANFAACAFGEHFGMWLYERNSTKAWYAMTSAPTPMQFDASTVHGIRCVVQPAAVP